MVLIGADRLNVVGVAEIVASGPVGLCEPLVGNMAESVDEVAGVVAGKLAGPDAVAVAPGGDQPGGSQDLELGGGVVSGMTV